MYYFSSISYTSEQNQRVSCEIITHLSQLEEQFTVPAQKGKPMFLELFYLTLTLILLSKLQYTDIMNLEEDCFLTRRRIDKHKLHSIKKIVKNVQHKNRYAQMF